jgi:hypothetical protein
LGAYFHHLSVHGGFGAAGKLKSYGLPFWTLKLYDQAELAKGLLCLVADEYVGDYCHLCGALTPSRNRRWNRRVSKLIR